MKAIYEQIDNASLESSFLYRRFSLPKFNVGFHYHPEIELTLIEKSAGKRFVGGHVGDFEAGDLVLLGENLPHCWLNSDAEAPDKDAAQAIVIQFKADFAGAAFWHLPEMKAIGALLQKAQAGVAIKGHTRAAVATKMRHTEGVPAFEKMLLLFDILHTIATSEETELLDVSFSKNAFSTVETERFRTVYAYIIEHYTDTIALETIANVANMTPTAFCRYFKKMTRRTFVDVVTELRVRHACQALISSERPVLDVCYESGFGNISYFNKEFKKATGHTPLHYRKLFAQNRP